MLEIPKQEGLKFSEPDHAYTYNGRPILSITQILRDVGISPDFGTVHPDVLKVAATRGTNVHSLTQFYDEDDLGEVAPEYRGYLDAWIAFRKASGFVPDFIEAMLYHNVYGYGGRPDRSGLIDGKRAIVEIKTGEGPTLHDSIGCQLAAQAMLLEDIVKSGPVKIRIAVKLHRDGSYTQREFKDPRDRGVFLAACTVANYKQGRK